jgi:hypothetical protein
VVSSRHFRNESGLTRTYAFATRVYPRNEFALLSWFKDFLHESVTARRSAWTGRSVECPMRPATETNWLAVRPAHSKQGSNIFDGFSN